MLEETYFKIISSKTAELFSASTKVGAILSDKENKDKRSFRILWKKFRINFSNCR